MTTSSRKAPNILITGKQKHCTPGVGKSTICSVLAERCGLRWFDVSRVALESGCLEEFDEVYQCPILDEDKLLDTLEGPMSTGGNIVDYHGCDFFPERWFDIVFVVRADNTTLYDRLVERGYTGKKLEDNLQCEIFQTILEEARGAYSPEIVHELRGESEVNLLDNLGRIAAWLEQWIQDQQMS